MAGERLTQPCKTLLWPCWAFDQGAACTNSPSAGAVAIGFATPAATAVTVADQLLATGTAQHAYVGIQPATLTAQIARQLGLSQNTGVVVLQVVSGSPAATAGLQPGDVITAFNGQNTSTAEEFIAKLRPVKPGDQIKLTVLRAGATQQIAVTVADRPKCTVPTRPVSIERRGPAARW